MLSFVLLFAASAAPLQVAAPDLSGIDIEPARATFYTEHLGQALARQGMVVVTGKQMKAVIGLERQKALLGCGEESASCMAELASALGADVVLSGTIARAGRGFRMSLNLLSARDGVAVVAHASKVNDEDALFDALDAAAVTMARELRRKLRPGEPEVAEVTASRPSSSRGLAWVPGAAGLVFAGAGGVLYLQSSAAAERLRTETFPSLAAGEKVRDDAKLKRGLAFAGFGLGAAGLVTAAVMFFSGDGGPEVAVVPMAGGAAAAVGGRF